MIYDPVEANKLRGQCGGESQLEMGEAVETLY